LAKEAAPRPGDRCPRPECRGHLRVYKTRINFIAAVRVRYLHCPECGFLPTGNKWILPLEYAPSRRGMEVQIVVNQIVRENDELRSLGLHPFPRERQS